MGKTVGSHLHKVVVQGKGGDESTEYSVHADDTQFHYNCRPDDTDALRNRLSYCARDIISWCTSRRLQLNVNKTEAWVGSKSNLAKLTTRDYSIQIGESTIQPSTIVRDLGVYLHRELSMKQHIAKVAASCYYHLRRLRQIRRRVGGEVATRLVLALIVSRIDYCNSVLAGLPQSTIAPLQRVQNASARLVFELGTREHVTASLLQLHALAASPLASPVQAVLSYALHLSPEVSGLPIRHREACRSQSFTRRPTIFFNNDLRDAAATDNMWRARLFSRWACCVERSTGSHACCF